MAAAKGTVCRTGKEWSEARQARFARKCVRQGFAYCNENAWRYTPADAFTAGAHIALPHVRPDIFCREFDRVAQNPMQVGSVVAKGYRDGQVLYSSAEHARQEAGAATSLWALSKSAGGGLTRTKVARALGGLGVDRRRFEAVQALAEGGQAIINPNTIRDPLTLRLAARAYRSNGGGVIAVGAAAGKALGVQPYSAHGLAESLTRTSHLRSLWRGLRTPGGYKHKLWVAEQIRAHAHTRLKPGSLVVAAVDDASDAKAIGRVAEAVRKAGGKLVLTGPGAREFAQLAQSQVSQATPKAGQKLRGAHL
jgi:hypothetical protein